MAMLMSAMDWPRLDTMCCRLLGMVGVTVRPLAFNDKAITGCFAVGGAGGGVVDMLVLFSPCLCCDEHCCL